MPLAYDLLEDALENALRDFLRRLLMEVDVKDVYAAGLYTSGELNYLVPTANTRSAWARMGTSKWSPPDWAFHLYASDAFEMVDAVLQKGWTDDFTSFELDELQARLIIHRQLTAAREEFFEGSPVVMGLFMGGMGHGWVMQSVRAVNSSLVSRAFEVELGQEQSRWE